VSRRRWASRPWYQRAVIVLAAGMIGTPILELALWATLPDTSVGGTALAIGVGWLGLGVCIRRPARLWWQARYSRRHGGR
jgi:hypothetical protein